MHPLDIDGLAFKCYFGFLFLQTHYLTSYEHLFVILNHGLYYHLYWPVFDWLWTFCPRMKSNYVFIFKKLFIYCCSITVVCIFSPPLHSSPANPTTLPCLHPPPWFCSCVLYSSSWKPFSPLSPPHSPLIIVRLFLTSMSLVIFCFLFSSSIDYVPVKGEIIWYLSFTVWRDCFKERKEKRKTEEHR